MEKGLYQSSLPIHCQHFTMLFEQILLTTTDLTKTKETQLINPEKLLKSIVFQTFLCVDPG